MDFFSANPTVNILPRDGIAHYHGAIMSAFEARSFYEKLLNTVPWKNDEAFIYGRHIITARKVAWYGDSNYRYSYSGTTKTALVWTPELLELKSLVESKTNTVFNSCLLNYYASGDEGMGWHSDDEKSLGRNTTIASVSFGAERKFSFRHKATEEAYSLILEDGSLLVMAGSTQTHWQHCVPKTKRIHTPRINLTFRTIVLQ